jgi:hypothetical protein
MNRWWNLALAVLFLWHGRGVAPLRAQLPIGGYTPPIQQRPTISPYLNLNRFGTNPAINYFDLVRPQVLTQQQLLNLRLQQGMLAGDVANLGTQIAPLDQQVPLSTTGHPVRYFDWSRYFPLYGLPAGSGVAVSPGTGFAPSTGVGGPLLRTGITPGFGIVVPR